jgi:hypothetical protein
MPPAAQYVQPSPFAKLWIEAYVRHVARFYPCEEDPDLSVTGVKVYRVVHKLPQPWELARARAEAPPDADPYAVLHDHLYDPTSYLPFFQGEFDKDGNLKKYYDVGLDGKPTEDQDPFLYWLIPIQKVPKQKAAPPKFDPFWAQYRPREKAETQEYDVKNYLLIHAGDEDAGN